MPEVNLTWMITNGFLFFSFDGGFNQSQHLAARIHDTAIAFETLEGIREKYHNQEWNLTLEVEPTHA
jgi:hypothetical protein